MHDEQLIRDAFDAIAGRAPAPEGVRAGIAARRRVHRQRRALLAGAGALGVSAAAAAVGVPLANRSTPASPAPPVLSASPVPPVPVGFAPTWLPDGVGEQFRRFVTEAGGGSSRTWMPLGMRYPIDSTGPKGVTLAIGERIDDDSGTPIQIGSVTGRLRVTDSVYLQWRPPGAPDLLLVVYALPDAQATALRVAQSVTTSTATMQLSMHSPWVPDRFAGSTAATVYPFGSGWRQVLAHRSADDRQSCAIVAQTTPAPASALRQVQRPDGMTLFVPGSPMTAPEQVPLTPQEAARLLDEVVATAPDLAWVGGR